MGRKNKRRQPERKLWLHELEQELNVKRDACYRCAYCGRELLFIGVALVLLLAAIGLGIEWYVYDTGQLKEHMTFLEWLLIQK